MIEHNRLLSFSLCITFLLSIVTPFASASTENNSMQIDNVMASYSIGMYRVNGTEHECLVRTSSEPIPTSNDDIRLVKHTATYYLPTTPEEISLTNSTISQIKSGIAPAAVSPPESDPWFQCEFALEVLEEIEIRYGDFSGNPSWPFIGIKQVNYGYYTNPNGDGHLSVSNVHLTVMQNGFINKPGGPGRIWNDQSDDTWPSNARVANKNSLLTWKPSGLLKVADMQSGQVGIVGLFKADVQNDFGNTSKIDFYCSVRAYDGWG